MGKQNVISTSVTTLLLFNLLLFAQVLLSCAAADDSSQLRDEVPPIKDDTKETSNSEIKSDKTENTDNSGPIPQNKTSEGDMVPESSEVDKIDTETKVPGVSGDLPNDDGSKTGENKSQSETEKTLTDSKTEESANQKSENDKNAEGSATKSETPANADGSSTKSKAEESKTESNAEGSNNESNAEESKNESIAKESADKTKAEDSKIDTSSAGVVNNTNADGVPKTDTESDANDNKTTPQQSAAHSPNLPTEVKKNESLSSAPIVDKDQVNDGKFVATIQPKIFPSAGAENFSFFRLFVSASVVFALVYVAYYYRHKIKHHFSNNGNEIYYHPLRTMQHNAVD